MKYIEKPPCPLIDRNNKSDDANSVDVIMLTLDAESFLEKSLYTIYREIPVRKLFVCDGGSKDSTLDILKKFPRVERHVRPDIRTTGKGLEFLISLTETDWVLIIDGDIELTLGWYDEMAKNKNSGDVLENSKEIMAYHMYRENKEKLEKDTRSANACHLGKREALLNFHCDDDFMWRYTDFLLRQSVEKAGYRYEKISSTYHIHNETERIPYKSDNEKNFSRILWNEPERSVLDKDKEKAFNMKHARAIVKYLDPEFRLVKNSKWLDNKIRFLDRQWIKENGPAWLERYDHGSSKRYSIKRFIYRHFFSKK